MQELGIPPSELLATRISELVGGSTLERIVIDAIDPKYAEKDEAEVFFCILYLCLNK